VVGGSATTSIIKTIQTNVAERQVTTEIGITPKSNQ
jgi:hypothetical protein